MTDYTQPDAVTKRVRFFDGQFLQDQDFVDEQKYHLDRERRIARSLRLNGTLDGLAVTSPAAFTVKVTAGTAVDEFGRQLVLPADTTMTLPATFARQDDTGVYLVYRQVETDIAVTGGKSARRWDDTPLVAVVATDGSTAVSPADALTQWDSQGVLLARLSVTDSGVITVTAGPAPAGLVVPGDLGVGGKIVDTSGPLSFEVGGGPQVTITPAGLVGVGTQTPENAENWNRVVDVYGVGNAKLSTRTDTVDARIMAHDSGFYGSLPGLIIGTKTPNGLGLVTSGLTRLTVTPTGDVGIGTTAPLNNEGFSRVLDVFGANHAKVSIRGGSVDARVIAHPDGFSGASPGMWVGVNTKHAVSLATSAQARLTVTSTGDVGIGAQVPENADGWNRVLDVLGNGNAKLSVRTASVDGRVMVHEGVFFGAQPGLLVGTKSRHAVSIVANSGARLTVTPDGNVGIGTTTPGARLDVVGLGTGASQIDLQVTGRLKSVSEDGGLWCGGDRFVGSVDRDKTIGFWNKGRWAFSITQDGNAGLGTTTPENADNFTRVLDVVGGASVKLSLRSTRVDARITASDGSVFGADPGLVVGTKGNSSVSLATNATTRLAITGDGRVGIGTTRPANARLEVAGSGAATDIDLIVSGRVQTGAGDGGVWVGDDRFVGGVNHPVSPNNPAIQPAVGFFISRTWALSVSGTGDVAIGQRTPENRDNFSRVVDVLGGADVKLSLRSGSGIDGRVIVSDKGFYGSRAGMVVGTGSQSGLSLATFGQTVMSLTPTQKVLVGTTDEASAKMTVMATDRMLELVRTRGVKVTNDPCVFLEMYEAGGSVRPSIRFRGSSWGSRQFYASPDGFRFMLESSDGSLNPTGLLGSSFTNPSDGRLKTGVAELTGTVETLEQIRGVRFTWKRDGDGASPEIGLIAQEVEAVLPELVATGEDGYKSLDYGKLTAVLVQAVKEQQSSIRQLRSRIDTLDPLNKEPDRA